MKQLVRALLVAALAATTITALAFPTVAQEDEYDIIEAIVEFMSIDAGEQLEAQYPETDEWTDPVGDFEFSTGETPGLEPASYVDLTSGALLKFDEESAGNESLVRLLEDLCERVDELDIDPNYCGDGLDDDAFSEGAYLLNFEFDGLAESIDPALECEFVFWFAPAEGEPVFNHFPDFPLDPADGTNQAIGYRSTSFSTGPFRLDLNSDGFFEVQPTNSIVTVSGNELAIFTPVAEIGEPTAFRAYSFCTEGGYSAADSLADSTELFPLGDIPVLSFVTAAPPATTTTSTTTTTTTTVPAATGGETPEATDETGTTTEAADDGGSAGPLIAILIGVVAIAVGVWLYMKKPSDDPHAGCDWALYVSDGGKRTALRKAQHGTECCVYDVEIKTTVDYHDEAASFRQDAESPHGADAKPDDRFRLPDLGYGTGNGYLWGWASARSGPAGRQDWMHGLGDPRATAGRVIDHSPESQLSQQRSHEERPDVAAHLSHYETTVVSASLDAGCGDYENTYTAKGQSDVFVQANQECTNGAPGPECPIEFTASGWTGVIALDDLTYRTSHDSASDVDELEPITERIREAYRLEGPMTQTDSHDHATKAVQTYEDTRSAKDAKTLKQDDFSVTLLAGLEVDAGTIVPVATWPTTERVTADIYTDIAHDIDLTAKMVKGDCASDGCSDHGDCQCEPSFSLQVLSDHAVLTVDGVTHRLERPDPDGSWKLV